MTDKKFMSLAEALAPPPEHPRSAPELEPATPDALLDPKAFAEALLTSQEFRQFILNSLTLGTLPSAVILRLMDYAWGKPVESYVPTGDGSTVEITEVRRVVVRPAARDHMDEDIVVAPRYREH